MGADLTPKPGSKPDPYQGTIQYMHVDRGGETRAVEGKHLG